MPHSAASREPRAHVIANHPGSRDFESVIRRLIDQNGLPPLAGDQGSTEEVVVGVEVDGVTYALVRLAHQTSPGMTSLSPREREIVRLVAKGFPNKTIAAVLDVSTWTVATHLRRVFAKLGVNTRSEMVAQALTHGLIEPERSR